MSRTTERYLPLLAGAIAGGAIGCADVFAGVEPFSRLASVGTMTLGVVVAGFTATQRNMLLGMGGTKVLRYAATTGYYKDVLDYLAHCIYASLLVTVVSVAGIFVENGGWARSSWLALWVGSIVLVVALMIRNECLMSRIFTHFMGEQSRQKGSTSASRTDQLMP